MQLQCEATLPRHVSNKTVQSLMMAALSHLIVLAKIICVNWSSACHCYYEALRSWGESRRAVGVRDEREGVLFREWVELKLLE